MKIAVLEKTNFTSEQRKKLEELGQIDYYENLSQDDANRIAPQYDVVIVNWLDPTPFIMEMKKGALVSLLSTGYGWISNIKEAYDNGIYVTNIPNYSTEAVAEHLLGMLLGISKNIFPTLNRDNNGSVGFELKNKTTGIIGLGNIGGRFAEIMNFFGSKVLTYNRTKKDGKNAQDVSLDYLLEHSDIICISCSVNDESRNMINMSNIYKIKKGAIIVGSTWNIIENDALLIALEKDIIKAISFDAAIEGNDIVLEKLKEIKSKVFLTPHIAYNTYESELRQLDICVNNILNYINGHPSNLVK